jgi:two-component system chemotaxis response regulator CheY
MEKTILLIDDDQDQLQFFSEALKRVNSHTKCVFANDADIAFKALDFLTPDFIFLSMHLPGMSGLACLSKIREHVSLRHVPVFVYAACYDEALKQKALAMGATCCLRKPRRLNVLAYVLKELVGTDTSTWREETTGLIVE